MAKRFHILSASPAWAVVALLAACATPASDGSDDASDDPCVPGQSIACECDDGSPGARICEPDGIGFDECVCEGDATESGPGVSASTDPSGPSDASAEGASADGSAEGSPTGDPSSASDEAGTDTSAAVPDFEGDIVPILQISCGANNSLCHARNAYFPNADQSCRGWASFENTPLGASFDDLNPATNGPPEGAVPGCVDLSLFDRLTELAPWECDTSWSYIAPGSLEDSYIYRKLTDATLCGDFRVMPPVGEGYQISQAQIDTLAAWILAGAPQ
jgi:hypothetical protein